MVGITWDPCFLAVFILSSLTRVEGETLILYPLLILNISIAILYVVLIVVITYNSLLTLQERAMAKFGVPCRTLIWAPLPKEIWSIQYLYYIYVIFRSYIFLSLSKTASRTIVSNNIRCKGRRITWVFFGGHLCFFYNKPNWRGSTRQMS
jgi:hypothetical protein